MKRIIPILMAVVMALTITCLPSSVSGSENLNINNISVGDHIYLGNNNAKGYTGTPYWTVLNVDKKNKTALILSEYLWMGDGDDAEAEPVFNASTSEGNTWKGSNAQQWCQDFYRDVLGSNSFIKKTTKTDGVYKSDEALKYGSCAVDDYVFLLSAEEAETYLHKSSYNNGRKAYRHNGIAHEWDSSTWWLRSPFNGYYSYPNDDSEESGFVFGGTGAIFGGFVDNECCMRPAFNLDLSNGIPASKNEYDQWIIDGYNTEDQFIKYENKGGYVGLKEINDSESWIEVYIYRLTGTDGLVKAYFDSDSTAYFDDEESCLSGEITISGNKLTLDLDEVRNFYFDTDLSDYIGGLHQEYYTSQTSKGNELDFSKDVWGFDNYFDTDGVLTVSHAHYLSNSDRAALMKDLPQSLKQQLNEEINKWEILGNGGHCHGFAATTILNKMGRINICNIAHSTSVRNAEKTAAVRSMICRYQLAQYIAGYKVDIIKFVKLSVKKRLAAIAEKTNAVRNGGTPVLIRYGADGFCHHVVGYALENGNFTSETTHKSYNRRVLIYDSNYPDWNSKACLLFNDGTDEWEVPAYAEKHGIKSANEDAYIGGCTDDLDVLEGKVLTEYDYTIVTIHEDESIILYNGDATIEANPKTGKATGSDDIISFRVAEYDKDSNESVPALNVVIPNKNKPCIIKPKDNTKGALAVGIKSKDKYVSVNAEKTDKATVTPSGELSISGNDGDVTMTVATDNKKDGEFAAYSVEGDTNGDIALSLTNNGASVKGDDVNGLTLAASNVEDKKYQITIENSSGAATYKDDDIERNGTEAHDLIHREVKGGYLKNGTSYDECTLCGKIFNKEVLPGYSTSYVKSLKVKAAKKACTISWKKQSKATQKKYSGYQIRYSSASDMTGAKYTTASKSSSSKKITKLLSKKKYYIQVRTCTVSKGTKFYSSWSTKSVKIK